MKKRGDEKFPLFIIHLETILEKFFRVVGNTKKFKLFAFSNDIKLDKMNNLCYNVCVSSTEKEVTNNETRHQHMA